MNIVNILIDVLFAVVLSVLASILIEGEFKPKQAIMFSSLTSLAVFLVDIVIFT